MASGKNSKQARRSASARASAAIKKPKPWGLVAAIVVVVLFAGGVFGFAYFQYADKQSKLDALAPFTPSQSNQDPSKQIEGVVTKDYKPQSHVSPADRVAYDQSPAFGGPHDGYWAACMGNVYPNPVRTENMVHSLEHGAVWIAYHPDKVQGAALEALKKKVVNQQFIMMSPYPTLDRPISLQSWGRQLKVDSADDPRIDQFIHALRRNQYTYPELNASCDALGPGAFDPDNPPPFDATPPGPDAKPMNYEPPAQPEQPGQPGGTQPGQPGGQPGQPQPQPGTGG
ncbi:DUF3105 domain-containing protein [Allokutzneria oryzae]|uniref:DUF3105 domain-containing protein n=1 Tax=Allokutzneria oryzae TaxID=1378989 RepID=A0ABV5ZY72_9PSEU